MARQAFRRVSFDLIYARPGQDVAAWGDELARALALGPDHLSVYQLTIEQGTAFWGAWSKGELALPPEEAQADLYALSQERLAAAGLPAYEVSNHARPGDESRHNLAYWRYRDYAGIGPGAHGRLTLDGTIVATEAHRKPEAWLAAAEAGDGTASAVPVAPTDAAAELLMMGLRLAEGVPEVRFVERAGAPMDAFVSMDRLDRLVRLGALERGDGRIRATAAGRPILNSLLADLLA